MDLRHSLDIDFSFEIPGQVGNFASVLDDKSGELIGEVKSINNQFSTTFDSNPWALWINDNEENDNTVIPLEQALQYTNVLNSGISVPVLAFSPERKESFTIDVDLLLDGSPAVPVVPSVPLSIGLSVGGSKGDSQNLAIFPTTAAQQGVLPDGQTPVSQGASISRKADGSSPIAVYLVELELPYTPPLITVQEGETSEIDIGLALLPTHVLFDKLVDIKISPKNGETAISAEISLKDEINESLKEFVQEAVVQIDNVLSQPDLSAEARALGEKNKSVVLELLNFREWQLFFPKKPTLHQLANFFGYDHFNFLNVITHDDQVNSNRLASVKGATPKPVTVPYADPPPNGGFYTGDARNFDKLPLYYREDDINQLKDNIDTHWQQRLDNWNKAAFDSGTFDPEKATRMTFFDSPTLAQPTNGKNHHIEYYTSLAGVTKDGQIDVLETFAWKSNYAPKENKGGIYDYSREDLTDNQLSHVKPTWKEIGIRNAESVSLIPIETPDIPIETPDISIETPDISIETPDISIMPEEIPNIPIELPNEDSTIIYDSNTGDNRLRGSKGDDQLRGNAGNDQFIGGLGDDQLRGNAGNDRLIGGAGNDRLIGGLGDDQLRGNAGNDRLIGGAGNDTFILAPGDGTDIIKDFEIGIDAIALAGGLKRGTLSFKETNNRLLIETDGQVLAKLTGIAPMESYSLLFSGG